MGFFEETLDRAALAGNLTACLASFRHRLPRSAHVSITSAAFASAKRGRPASAKTKPQPAKRSGSRGKRSGSHEKRSGSRGARAGPTAAVTRDCVAIVPYRPAPAPCQRQLTRVPPPPPPVAAGSRPPYATIDDVFSDIFGAGTQMGHDIQRGDDGADAEIEFGAQLQQLRAQGRVSPAVKVDYLNAFALLARFCKQHRWHPMRFSYELAEAFAASILKRVTRTGGPPARICGYFAAFNFVYAAAGKAKSWADDKGPIYDLRVSYKKASIAIGAQRGAEHPGLRVPIPAMGMHYIIKQFLLAHDPLTVIWFSVFIIMGLFWARADTMAGIRTDIPDDPDIWFSNDGYLCFRVRRVKRGNAGVQPFIRTIAPPPASNPTRRSIWRKLAFAIELVGPDGQRLLGPALWGFQPRHVSDKISTAMRTYLPKDLMGVDASSFISSHSFRKFGASAAASIEIGWYTIMRWGLWASITSPMAYVAKNYAVDPLFFVFFDFIMPPSHSTIVLSPEQILQALPQRMSLPVYDAGDPDDGLETLEDTQAVPCLGHLASLE